MSISKPSYNRHCKGVREIMTDHTAFNPCSLLPPEYLVRCCTIAELFDTSDPPGLIDPHIISPYPIFLCCD